jgi:hypothetical protein
MDSAVLKIKAASNCWYQSLRDAICRDRCGVMLRTNWVAVDTFVTVAAIYFADVAIRRCLG